MNLLFKAWNKLSSKLKYGFQDLLFHFGCGAKLLKNRPGGRILIYHGVTPQRNIGLNHRFITVDLFETQLRYFKAHFHLVSLERYCEGERHPEKMTLALTFDDGYAGNFRYVLPLLEKYKAHATFFVTGIRDLGRDILWADHLDLSTFVYDPPITIDGELFKKVGGEYRAQSTGKRLKQICKEQDHVYHRQMEMAFPPRASFREDEQLKDYWEQMTIDELKSMDQSPWASVELHGYLHTNLGAIQFENAVEELKMGKKFLEKLLQKEVKMQAFPDGSYTRPLLNSSRELGFKYQLIVQLNEAQDKSEDVFERFGIHPYLSFNNQIAALLKGSY